MRLLRASGRLREDWDWLPMFGNGCPIGLGDCQWCPAQEGLNMASTNPILARPEAHGLCGSLAEQEPDYQMTRNHQC